VDRCYPRDRPFAPYPSKTHLLFPRADDWLGTRKAPTRVMPALARRTNLSALSYQLFFGLTVVFTAGFPFTVMPVH
jgi:hypothetical protein